MDRAFYDYVYQLLLGQVVELQVEQPLILVITLRLLSGVTLLMGHYVALRLRKWLTQRNHS
jgi:hypothetical protein